MTQPANFASLHKKQNTASINSLTGELLSLLLLFCVAVVCFEHCDDGYFFKSVTTAWQKLWSKSGAHPCVLKFFTSFSMVTVSKVFAPSLGALSSC